MRMMCTCREIASLFFIHVSVWVNQLHKKNKGTLSNLSTCKLFLSESIAFCPNVFHPKMIFHPVPVQLLRKHSYEWYCGWPCFTKKTPKHPQILLQAVLLHTYIALDSIFLTCTPEGCTQEATVTLFFQNTCITETNFLGEKWRKIYTCLGCSESRFSHCAVLISSHST